jgi:excisionase family DNA binding protein
MPRTKPKPETKGPAVSVLNGPMADVLTLPEAGDYLRLPVRDVLRLVDEQGLPGRHVGAEWRFLKSAIQAWLSAPPPRGLGQGIWAAAGALKDDPYLEDMLKELERMRGRPATEER